MNSWSWIMFYRPLSWQTFLAVNISSLAFDLSHALANGVFLFSFGEQTLNILRRFKNRFRILIDSKIETLKNMND
jgi:energy-coupling factor transport system substrate-specific component